MGISTNGQEAVAYPAGNLKRKEKTNGIIGTAVHVAERDPFQF